MTPDTIRVGLGSCLLHRDPQRAIFKGKTLQYVEEKTALALSRAGALPIGLLDLKDDATARAHVALVDGLVLQGGADVAPASYGAVPLRPEWIGDRERDEHEMRLVEAALAAGKPILGLCRGIQLLNVALGGTLIQDIGTQVTDALVHRDWHRYEELEHEVKLAEGSWIAGVYGASTLLVNTVHHQAVERLAPGLRATAWAPDGIVEAAELIDAERWIVGLQWHPEWLDGSAEGGPHRSDGRPVFDAFMQACRARRTP
jgi:putative glutamine amidotransferase